MTTESKDKETGYDEVIRSLIKDKKESTIVEDLLKGSDVSELVAKMINFKGKLHD
jgi:hypothetical protein